MSMQTDCIYGYGFQVEVSDENLKDFIWNHKKTVETLNRGPEILGWIEERIVKGDPFDSMKEKFFDYESHYSNEEGLYGLIADVMSEESGIRFEYHRPQDEDDIEDVILFPESYPWYLNEVEKQLTQESFDEIIKKYIDDLGGHMATDYLRLEYFG